MFIENDFTLCNTIKGRNIQIPCFSYLDFISNFEETIQY